MIAFLKSGAEEGGSICASEQMNVMKDSESWAETTFYSVARSRKGWAEFSLAGSSNPYASYLSHSRGPRLTLAETLALGSR